MSTKESWSSRVRSDSNGTYQEWRDELITKLNLMDYLAADEETVTPASGAFPGANTEESYAVYHLNDSLHGTAPVYLRFGFGRAINSNAPRIQITCGTSTNGSGVLGGTCLSVIGTINADVGQTTDTFRNSYLCVLPGFFGLSWKQLSTAEGSAFFMRTVDNTGAPVATSGHLRLGSGANSSVTKSQAFRYAAPAAAYTAMTAPLTGSMLGFLPQAPASTLVGADIQVALGWSINPAAVPIVGLCGVLDAEVPTGTTFAATLVGSTPRTYIALTPAAGPFGPATVAAGFPKQAMLWE